MGNQESVRWTVLSGLFFRCDAERWRVGEGS